MPKKAKNVNDFSGGLNNNTTPRDLGDNEFQVLLNLSNTFSKLTLDTNL